MLEELQTKIIEMRNHGFSMAEVEASMRAQGYVQADIEQAIHTIGDTQMANFKQKHPIVSNRFFPLVCLILIQVIFFYLIPTSTAEEFYILFALLGGAATLIFSFWTVANLAPVLFEKFPIATGISCISTLFVFGFVFISMTSSFASDELQQHGKKVMARVSDMTRIIGKRNDIYSMKVVFPCDGQVNCEASIDLSEQQYHSLEEGMSVPIIYSTRHPNIARMDYGQ